MKVCLCDFYNLFLSKIKWNKQKFYIYLYINNIGEIILFDLRKLNTAFKIKKNIFFISLNFLLELKYNLQF